MTHTLLWLTWCPTWCPSISRRWISFCLTVKRNTLLCCNFMFTYKFNNLGRIYKKRKWKQTSFKTITMFTTVQAGSSSRPVLSTNKWDSWRVMLECCTLRVICVPCIGLLHLSGFLFLIHLKSNLHVAVALSLFTNKLNISYIFLKFH